MQASVWTFTVVAAAVTTFGTLFGHFLKEVVLARSFDTWKRRQTIRDVQRRYRDPIVLAASELASRLDEIVSQYPTDFLDRSALDSTHPRTYDSHRDAYFKRYKCQSTVYRLAALLGWLELYRQELVFMDAEAESAEKPVEACRESLRADLADGQLNTAHDWSAWADALIFREEQRAIGEAMIVGAPPGRTVLGDGAFVSAMENSEHASNRWIKIAEHFCVDHKIAKDFRRTRLERMFVHLVDLIHALDPGRTPKWLSDASLSHRRALVNAGQKGFVAAAAA